MTARVERDGDGGGDEPPAAPEDVELLAEVSEQLVVGVAVPPPAPGGPPAPP